MSSWGEMQDLVGRYRREHGFITPQTISNKKMRVTHADVMLGKIALMQSELGEAAEAVRDHNYDNFYEELADVVIRIMDVCDATGVYLWPIIEEKMEINIQRPHRHGRRTTL
jgi:NTP pyrophosphatase (non-canonical NTP hydrolase)